MKYPAPIIDDAGHWGVILRGHNLPLHTVMIAADDILGRDHGPLHLTEVFFTYKPRVKWCGNYGSSCDIEGEWHNHWFEVRPSMSESLKFTTAYPVKEAQR